MDKKEMGNHWKSEEREDKVERKKEVIERGRGEKGERGVG
jgi:hypothetical protein